MTKRIIVIIFLILVTICVDKAIQGNLIRIRKIVNNESFLSE